MSVKLAARLQIALFRGNRFILAFGTLYVRAPRLDVEIRERIEAQFTKAHNGQAFLRWAHSGKKNKRIAPLVAGMGRLGNSIIQVLNIRSIASVLNASEAFYHRFDAIHNSTLELEPGITFRKLPITNGVGKRRPDVLWRTYAFDSEHPLSPPCEPASNQVRNALRTAIAFVRGKEFSRPNMTLTIYLRSGDVFSEMPEPHYGQPPWAFYERVLECRRWTSVELIAEDQTNPNYDLIVKWCQERSLNFREMGKQLDEAIRYVMRSRNLVSARGTFVPSLVFLSEGPKNIFQFHDEGNPLMCREELTVWKVSDTRGDYVASVMSKNWENSSSQRALMVSYPKSSLSDVTEMAP